MEASARQKKRKRAEFEPVLSGHVSMKLELARSKAALKDQVAQNDDAQRLLRESTVANLEKTAQIQKYIIGLHAAKRSSRWFTASNKALIRKNDMQPIVGNRYFVNHSNCKLVSRHTLPSWSIFD